MESLYDAMRIFLTVLIANCALWGIVVAATFLKAFIGKIIFERRMRKILRTTAPEVTHECKR